MNASLRLLSSACAAALLSGGAGGQTSPYYIGGLVAYGQQSNALGIADGATVPGNLGYVSKSDKVTSLALIGGLDQQVGRQRLFGDVTLRDNRYDRNHLLNHKSYSVSAAIDWQTIRRISGNLTLKSTRDLVRFSSFDQPTGGRNLVNTRLADASARIGVVTRYTFEAGLSQRSVDYSDAAYASRDFRQRSASIGARYWPSGSNYAGVTVRDTKGRYPGVTGGNNVAADEFDRQDVELSTSLETSGFSTVFARAAYSKIDHSLRPELDYSGVTGLFRGTLTPTAKLQLTGELARDRGQDIGLSLFDPNSGFTRVESARLTTIARLRVGYAATAKTELHANASSSRRTISQTNVFTNAAESGRERSSQYGLGASWTPTRTSRVGCDVSRDRRRSDIASAQLNVSSNSTTCFAQLTVQP